MKGTSISVIAIFLISLAIWTAYSLTSYPLGAAETVVVVGAVGLVVMALQWLIARLKKKDTKEVKHD